MIRAQLNRVWFGILLGVGLEAVQTTPLEGVILCTIKAIPKSPPYGARQPGHRKRRQGKRRSSFPSAPSVNT